MRIVATLYKADMRHDYLRVLEGLAERGHDVNLFLHEAPVAWKSPTPRLQVTARNSYPVDRFSFINRMSLAAIAHIRRQGTDVIHAMDTEVGEGLLTGLVCGVPVVCDVRNPWTVQLRHTTTKYAWGRQYIGMALRKVRCLGEARLIHRASRVVAYSPGLRDWLVQSIQVASSKVTVIPPHADTAHFRPDIDGMKVRARYSLQDAVVLMYAGVLSYSVGLDLLLDAVIQVQKGLDRPIKLVLVGPGTPNRAPYVAVLEERARVHGLADQLVFTGFVPFVELPEYYAASDILVAPHRMTFSNSMCPPVKVLEYMAMGKPVVATDVCVRQFVEHMKSGILVPPDNPSALAHALQTLCSDPALGAELGRHARFVMVNDFPVEKMVSQWEDILGSSASG